MRILVCQLVVIIHWEHVHETFPFAAVIDKVHTTEQEELHGLLVLCRGVSQWRHGQSRRVRAQTRENRSPGTMRGVPEVREGMHIRCDHRHQYQQ